MFFSEIQPIIAEILSNEYQFLNPFAGKFLYLLFVTGLIGPEGRPEDGLRNLGASDQALPAVEDFLLPSADETAPEVVEEEILDDHGGFSLEEEEAEPACAAPAEPTPPPWEAPPPDDRPGLILDEEDGEEAMAEDDIFAEPRSTVTVFEKPEEMSTPEIGDESAPEGEVEAMGDDDDEDEDESGERGEEAPESQYRDDSEILEAYMQVKGKDFYALLGVGPEAGDAEVEAAYHKVFDSWDWSLFSPDIDMEVMAKLEEIHTQIIRAYESLRTEKNREAYRQKNNKDADSGGMKDKLAAEQCLKKGLDYVRKRDWPRAQQMFEQAVQASPREPEFKSYLGWTIYQNPTMDLAARREQAKKLLAEAVCLNPQMDASHVFLGKILKEEGKRDEAEEEFKVALRANPRCREADRELKAHTAGEW